MRRTTEPTFTPDAAKATDATVDAAARHDAAQDLIRGQAVRDAASDALIRATEGTDERDTGSQLPGDVMERARDATRAAGRALDAARRNDAPSVEPPDEATQDEPPASDAYTKTVDDAITNDVQAHPTGQVASPASNERHRMAMGDPQDATTRTKGAVGPRAKGPGRPAGKAGAQHVERARTTSTSRPTRVLARTHASQPTAQVARRTSHGMAARRTVASGARAALTSGTATGASAGGGAIAAGSGGAGIAAAPVAVIILVLLLVVVLFGTLLGGGAVEEDQARGAHRLAQTATDEYLAGERRGDYNHKGLAYSAYVRGAHGGKGDWDVCLVGWCMAQAGFVDAGLAHAYGDVGSYVAHFRHNPRLGEVHDWHGDDYAPVEGDLFVVPYTDGTEHVGIVTSCDGTLFETVEGDVAGGPNGTYDRDEEDGCGGYVACRTRRLGQYSYTFIHPYYSEEAVTGR